MSVETVKVGRAKAHQVELHNGATYGRCMAAIERTGPADDTGVWLRHGEIEVLS